MSEKTIFELFEGMIQVQYAFWSRSKTSELPIDEKCISIYDKSDKTPLYFHIRLQDLFVESGNGWRILDKAAIHIDILSIHYSMYRELQEKENFANVGKYVDIVDSFKLNLTEDKKITFKDGEVIDGVALPKTVVGLADAPFDAFLTKLPSRNTSSALNAFEYDLCFEFKGNEAFQKKIFTESVMRKYVFAWAWVVHETSKEEYKTGLNIDITQPAGRIDMLKNPKKNFFGAIDLLLAPVSNVKRYSRANLYMKKFNDGYPYDEQSFNYVEMSQCLPFKSFAVGAQLGQVGLSTMDSAIFDRYIHKHRSNTSIYVVNGIPSIHCKLDSDKHFVPDKVADRGVVTHGLKSNLNEFISRADNRFFFKEKSVALWLNTIEKDYPFQAKQGLFSKGKYPFEHGKIDITEHDFIKKYRTVNDQLARYPGLDRFIEQKTIDLSEFNTIKILPVGEVSNEGNTFAKIGKGFPGNESFIETMHTKIRIESSDDFWQAHAICHRPIIITYELERDLTDEEKQRLQKNPVKMVFWKIDNSKRTKVNYELQLDTSDGLKKGKHALILYIVTNELQLEITIDETGVVPIDNHILLDGSAAHYFDCSPAYLQPFTCFTPESTGLFNDNPLITFDDLVPDSQVDAKMEKLRTDYYKEMNTKGISFIADFLPGKVKSAFTDYGTRFANIATQVDTEKDHQKESKEREIKTFFQDLLKKKDDQNNLSIIGTDDIELNKERANVESIRDKAITKVSTGIKYLKFIQEIRKLRSDYLESSSLVGSPMLNGIGFGEGQYTDTSYSMAVASKTYQIDSKTLTCTITPQTNGFEFFNNRKIKYQNKDPFDYQFGSSGGRLIRKNYKDVDSLSQFRPGFQDKIIKLKLALFKNKQVTVVNFLQVLASEHSESNLPGVLKSGGVNSNIIIFVDSKNIPLSIKNFLQNPSKLPPTEQANVLTILKLVLYVDARFIYCPACKQQVSLDWGWCPYHATRDQLKLTDGNGSGKLKDEFLLMDETKQSIQTILNSPIADKFGNANNDRLLVHWTEFIIG